MTGRWRMSLGMTACVVGGFSFQKLLGIAEPDYMQALFNQLGTPADPCLLCLPRWPTPNPPPLVRQRWPSTLLAKFGLQGEDLLSRLLSWSPAMRISAQKVGSQRSLPHGPWGRGLWGPWGRQGRESTRPPEDMGVTVPFSNARASLQVLEHPAVLVPTSLTLGGLQVDGTSPPNPACFKGYRHDWNIVTGHLAPEVLQWLRADPPLTAGTAEFGALGIAFGADGQTKTTETERERENPLGSLAGWLLGLGLCPFPAPGFCSLWRFPHSPARNSKTEEGRKWIKAGSVGSCNSTAMCTLSLDIALPLPRLRAWMAAFRIANGPALHLIEDRCRSAVLQIPSEARGQNGAHFLATAFADWFLTCAELAVTAAAREGEEPWTEPCHQDGGASILHMGITLYGRRRVILKQEADRHGADLPNGSLPHILVPNLPGTVYIGQLTGSWHQVTHEAPPDPGESWMAPGLGPCAVSVMLRCALFPHARSRVRNTTPAPPEVFRALAEAARASLGSVPLRLPSLKECLAVMAEPSATALLEAAHTTEPSPGAKQARSSGPGPGSKEPRPKRQR